MSYLLDHILSEFSQQAGTDLYLTVGSVPLMRGEGAKMTRLSEQVLDEEMVKEMIQQLIDEEAYDEFTSTLEYNTAISWKDQSRFRLNVFRQRQHSGMVLRRINAEIPKLADLGLPQSYAKLAMEKRGLVLIVGPTGSGKSTSMAAMVNERNENSAGHIVTVEDPVEYVHEHKSCIITQRDVGIDTYSYGIALKNVLRQRPDVIVIGEIRDRDTMEHALKFSETGHLCIATLHAGNTLQTLERIVSFFPEDKHAQVWLTLSLNLKGILSQRLVSNEQGARSLACEVMLNQGLIRNLIHEGKVNSITEMIEKSRDLGMISFDQSLMELVKTGRITDTVAVAEADNAANIKLHITRKDMNERLSIPAKEDPIF